MPFYFLTQHVFLSFFAASVFVQQDSFFDFSFFAAGLVSWATMPIENKATVRKVITFVIFLFFGVDDSILMHQI